MKSNKRLSAAILAAVIVAGSFVSPWEVKAAEPKENYPLLKEDESEDQPFCVEAVAETNTKDVEIKWQTWMVDSEATGFNIELCQDSNFANGKIWAFSPSMDQVTKTEDIISDMANYSYHIPFTTFGDGAEFYVRVKNNIQKEFSKKYGYSGESYSVWKICDNNFKGMTKLLKSGRAGNYNYYDRNFDGWLSPHEMKEIEHITNGKVSRNKDGATSITFSSMQCAVTGFKGIEKFKRLHFIDFTGIKMKSAYIPGDKHYVIGLYNVRSKEFKLKADSGYYIYIEADSTAKKKSEKLTKIDVSQCKFTRSFYLSCRSNGKVKLPASKNLLQLSLLDINMKTLDCNKFPRLVDLNIYRGKYSAIKADKCKSLLYVNIDSVKGLSKLNFSKNKKLRALAYDHTKIKRSNIKTPKKCKVTNKKGAWWTESLDYKWDVQDRIWE